MPRPQPLTLPLHAHLPHASRLVYGCMGLGGSWNDLAITDADRRAACTALDAAVEAGITCFDHADLYKHGRSEQVFGDWLARGARREDLCIQSKGGIVRGTDSNRYDLSQTAIVSCVEGSLRRLQTDYLDLWLLHRPDPLMDAGEIAAAFEALHTAGKVRHFGVSNMHATQVAWLAAAMPVSLLVNQIEMSLARVDWIDEGVDFNLAGSTGNAPVAATVDWCRQNGVQLQAWGALARGAFSGVPGDRSGGAGRLAARPAAALVAELARRHDVAPEAIVLAFLLRHPARIQPVIGSTQPARIRACAAAPGVELTRDEWYSLYLAARGRPLP